MEEELWFMSSKKLNIQYFSLKRLTSTLTILASMCAFSTQWNDDCLYTHSLVSSASFANSQSCIYCIPYCSEFPDHFDESKLFQGEASELKEEFRLKFLNISRIMDCVGCDKCKLWGKVQVRLGYRCQPFDHFVEG